MLVYTQVCALIPVFAEFLEKIRQKIHFILQPRTQGMCSVLDFWPSLMPPPSPHFNENREKSRSPQWLLSIIHHPSIGPILSVHNFDFQLLCQSPPLLEPELRIFKPPPLCMPSKWKPPLTCYVLPCLGQVLLKITHHLTAPNQRHVGLLAFDDSSHTHLTSTKTGKSRVVLNDCCALSPQKYRCCILTSGWHLKVFADVNRLKYSYH